MWNKLKNDHPVIFEIVQWGMLAIAVLALVVSLLALNYRKNRYQECSERNSESCPSAYCIEK